MPFFPNTFISTTRTGSPVLSSRYVQWVEGNIKQGPDSPSAAITAASAVAPILQKVVFDEAGTDYREGDVLTVASVPSQPLEPRWNPWYVVRVQDYGSSLLPTTKVYLARLGAYTQTVQWCQAITGETPNAAADTDFDVTRQQTLTQAGPTYGTGFSLVVGGHTYHGYLPAQNLTAGVVEYATLSAQEELGRIDYETPALIVEPGVLLAKWDLVVLPDARRLVVSDLQHRVSIYGVTLGTVVLTEQPMVSTRIYDVPLTGG